MSKEILEMMQYRPPEARNCGSCRYYKEFTQGDGPEAVLVHGCDFPNVGMVRLPGDGGVCQHHKTPPVARTKSAAKKKAAKPSRRPAEETQPPQTAESAGAMEAEQSAPESRTDEGTPPPTQPNE